jgi:hypothetical protein
MYAPNITFMKNIYLSVVASVLILFISDNVVAQSYTLTDADVEVNSDGVITSCSYGFSNKNIIIPQVLDAKTIKGIDNTVFRNKGIISVVLPSLIESIGDHAFQDNKLKAVSLPESIISLGLESFGYNEIESITIPSNLTVITQGAFCQNDITEVTIPSNVLEIGNYAFKANEIVSVTFNNKITNIGSMAFQNNKLSSVSIPNTVTIIGSMAFSNNQNLPSIVFPTPSANSEGIPFSYWQRKGHINTTYAGGATLLQADMGFEYYAVFENPEYTITGTIFGASAVEITMSGDVSGTQTKGHMQSYSFTVPEGSDVTISATKEGFTFNDPVSFSNITENKSGVNFVADPIRFDIGGKVTGASGVTIALDNGDSVESGTVPDDGGSYEFDVLYGSNATITASKEGYTFNDPVVLTNIKSDKPNINFTATIISYTISGVITGDIKEGVTVKLKDGETVLTSTTTDQSGNYSLSINYGTTATLTANAEGYSFGAPINISNVTADKPNCNFTSEINSYTISGTVTGVVKEGVTILLKNGATELATATTDNSGNYSIETDYGTTGVLTASLDGYTFGEPIEINNLAEDKPNCNFVSKVRTYTISGTVTGADYVTITMSDSQGILEVTTVSDGEVYNFTIDQGKTVTVSASKNGYTFNEAYTLTSVNGDIIDKDFTATINSYTISGNITGADGVVVKLAGDVDDTKTVNSGEAYNFTVNYGANVTITATKEGYIFTPVKYVMSEVGDNITGKDFVGNKAIAVPEIVGSLNFGNVAVGLSQTDKFTVKNTGNTDLVLNSIVLPEGFSVSESGLTVLPGALSNISVTFEPTEIKDYSGEIKLTGNFATSPVSVPVVANGIEALYTVVISITDGTEPIENAVVVFNNKEYTSNSVGDAVIEDVKTGTYNYTVNAEGYDTYTGTVVVSNQKEVKEVVLTKNSGGTNSIDISDRKLNILISNPVEDILQIELPADTKVDIITIYDIKGNLQYKKQILENRYININVSDLTKGVYVVQIKHNGEVIAVNKFIKK